MNSLAKHEIEHYLREHFDPCLDYPDTEIQETAARLWKLDFDGHTITAEHAAAMNEGLSLPTSALVEPFDPEQDEAI